MKILAKIYFLVGNHAECLDEKLYHNETVFDFWHSMVLLEQNGSDAAVRVITPVACHDERHLEVFDLHSVYDHYAFHLMIVFS